MLSFIEIHIVVLELQPDKKVAGTRIIITRRLQLQATVKRFRGDPDHDLDIDFADYYWFNQLVATILTEVQVKRPKKIQI